MTRLEQITQLHRLAQAKCDVEIGKLARIEHEVTTLQTQQQERRDYMLSIGATAMSSFEEMAQAQVFSHWALQKNIETEAELARLAEERDAQFPVAANAFARLTVLRKLCFGMKQIDKT